MNLAQGFQMVSNRFLVAACLVALPLAACGGSESDDDEEEPLPIPAGAHHGYVVSKVTATAAGGMSATSYGLDLGSPKSSQLDGRIDNGLGGLINVIAGFVEVKAAIDDAIDQGALNLLIDFQTTDFGTAPAAGFGVKFGENPMPAPCTDVTDTTCRKHLAGTATFTLAANSPAVVVAGKVGAGTFNGGPGNISLQLPLGGPQGVTLNLERARVKATTISESGITAIIGGLIRMTDLADQIGPAIAVQVNAVIEADCGPAPRTAPACGCPGGAGISTILGLADGTAGTAADCVISKEEIFGNPTVMGLLTADACADKSCSAPNAVSVGVKVEAVKATFPL